MIKKVLKPFLFLMLLFLGLLTLFLFWGMAIEPCFLDIEEHTVSIPSLPPSWEGREVAVLVDFQVGMWLDNVRTIKRAVKFLVEVRPLLVLIPGDFIYHREKGGTAKAIQEVQTLLQPLLESGIPVYGVFGNHDYGMKTRSEKPDERLADRLETALEKMGLKILHNEAVALAPSFAATRKEPPLYIVGIGAHWPGNDRPRKAFAAVPPDAPRLVMMHHPDSFENLLPSIAPLAVAGHTHGGQVRLPYTPEWTWLNFYREDKVHADGWIDENYGKKGNRLYVSRGIGFSFFPIRFNCPPELTVFTLKRG